MRNLILPLLGLIFAVILSLFACQAGLDTGQYELVLSETILNDNGNRNIISTEVFRGTEADSVMSLPDSIFLADRPNQQRYPKFRFRPRTGFLEGIDTGRVIVRTVDSLATNHSIMRAPDGERWRVRIPAVDFSAGGDSVRVGLIQFLDPVAEFFGETPDTASTSFQDYLLITHWGQDKLNFTLDQSNVGPISKQTVFRIDRNHYFVESIDSNRQYMLIRKLEDASGLSPTAEIDPYYKRVVVNELDGTPTSVRAAPGRKLALYFWQLEGGDSPNEELRAIDSLHRSLPTTQRERVDIALINRGNNPKLIEEFVEKYDIRLSVYLAAPKTCRNLNCRPRLPYWVSVGEQGRILSYHNPGNWLADMLQAMIGPK